jgi:hypothetical protein
MTSNIACPFVLCFLVTTIATPNVHQHHQLLFPKGVEAPRGIGDSCYIGLMDESTVLKYPLIKGRSWNLIVAEEMHGILGRPPTIPTCFHFNEHNFKLEYAPKGPV